MTTLFNSDKASLGKLFEAHVHRSFKDLQESLPVKWERFEDSRSAAAFLKVKPSDFRFQVNSGVAGQPYVFLIECKSSDKFEDFPSCFRSMIKAGQRAQMMIDMRAGAQGLYLFFSSVNQQVEVWEATPIIEQWPDKRKPLVGSPVLRLALDQLSNFAATMAKSPRAYTTGEVE